MRKNSIDAYNKIVASGQVKTQEEKIHNLVYLAGPISRREISQIAGMETSAVSGRVNTLMLKGFIEEHGDKICETTKKTVATLVAKTKPKVK